MSSTSTLIVLGAVGIIGFMLLTKKKPVPEDFFATDATMVTAVKEGNSKLVDDEYIRRLKSGQLLDNYGNIAGAQFY